MRKYNNGETSARQIRRREQKLFGSTKSHINPSKPAQGLKILGRIDYRRDTGRYEFTPNDVTA